MIKKCGDGHKIGWKINGVRRRRSKPMDLEKWAKMKKRKEEEDEKWKWMEFTARGLKLIITKNADQKWMDERKMGAWAEWANEPKRRNMDENQFWVF